MPTAKVTKNVSAATGGGNVLCSTLISIKTKAWLYSFGTLRTTIIGSGLFCHERLAAPLADSFYFHFCYSPYFSET